MLRGRGRGEDDLIEVDVLRGFGGGGEFLVAVAVHITLISGGVGVGGVGAFESFEVDFVADEAVDKELAWFKVLECGGAVFLIVDVWGLNVCGVVVVFGCVAGFGA